MKFKILLFIVSLFAFSSSFAASLKDSIGVKNYDGKKMVVFKIKSGDTYYSIGHRYNIKPAVLMKFNGAKKETLSLGKIIYIPTDIPFKKGKKESSESVAKEKKTKQTNKTKKKHKTTQHKQKKQTKTPKKPKHQKQPKQTPKTKNVQLP